MRPTQGGAMRGFNLFTVPLMRGFNLFTGILVIACANVSMQMHYQQQLQCSTQRRSLSDSGVLSRTNISISSSSRSAALSVVRYLTRAYYPEQISVFQPIKELQVIGGGVGAILHIHIPAFSLLD